MPRYKPIVLSEVDIKRFLTFAPKRRPKKQCWIWRIGLTKAGYGRFSTDAHDRFYVHRISFTVFKGSIPNGHEICHNCPNGDTPACWNPNHLWSGTQRENIQDCVSKKRHSHGEKRSRIMKAAFSRIPPEIRRQRMSHPELVRGINNGHAKITEVDVKRIRKLHGRGFKATAISRLYPVPISRGAIEKIYKLQNWKHVP